VKVALLAPANVSLGNIKTRVLRTFPGLARHVVELQKVAHLGQPTLLHEPHMIRVLVIALVGGPVGELHLDPEAVGILRADLGQELECLHARDHCEPFGGLEEVPLFRRALRMGERERDCVPDASRDHAVSLRRTSFGTDLRERLPRRDRLGIDPELEESRPLLGECALERIRKVF
jgi:hypothetical protein